MAKDFDTSFMKGIEAELNALPARRAPLERAARAIANRENPDGIAGVGDWFWQQYLPHARAVIEAIREPSDAMWNAGDDECPHRDTANPAKVWAAMIDALLADESDPVDYDETDGPPAPTPRIGPEFRRSAVPIRIPIENPASRK